MNCAEAKENIALYIYDELADDAKVRLEHHTSHCPACKAELEAALAFKEDMSAYPMVEVSPNFLTASRMKLQEALEHAEQQRGWRRFTYDVAGWMHQIKLAPALTAALLIVGFAGGSLTTYRIALDRTPNGGPKGPSIISEGNLAGIDSIIPEAGSNRVRIKYDTFSPQMVEGTADDPRIHQLLMAATHDNQNSGLRLDAFNLLTSKSEDREVREALVYALRYDRNPGVRLKALDGLKDYVKDDVHVRDAVLEALLHDTNAGVRSEAISLLSPVKADMSVREALQVLAERDPSNYIRVESKRFLASTSNLE